MQVMKKRREKHLSTFQEQRLPKTNCKSLNRERKFVMLSTPWKLLAKYSLMAAHHA